MIVGYILLALCVLVVVLTIFFAVTDTFSFKGPVAALIALLLLCSTFVVFTPTVSNTQPTKQDVLNGKAIYQETQVIIGNDTIKTYDIVWK